MTNIALTVVKQVSKTKVVVAVLIDGRSVLTDELQLSAQKQRAEAAKRMSRGVPGCSARDLRNALDDLANRHFVPPSNAKSAPGEELDGVDDVDGSNADATTGSKPQQLYALAIEHFTLFVDRSGVAYACPKKTPGVLFSVTTGNDGFGGELLRLFHEQTGDFAPPSAIQIVCATLVAHARREEPRLVFVRVAQRGDELLLDLADLQGRCVSITPECWRVVLQPEVHFLRGPLRGTLPEPERGGSLEELRACFNFAPGYFELFVAWLIHSLFERRPCPIVLLCGEQGIGKSSAARNAVRLIDPGSVELKRPPRDEEQWAVLASSSRLVALDNLSSIPAWFSDALCCASTGAAFVSRKLFTNSEPSVMSVMRPILLTSVDPGALRGDLAERILFIDLVVIDPKNRLTEEELDRRFEAGRRRMLGALLDLVVRVLDRRRTVKLVRSPRMADFATTLAAVDAVTGWNTLDTYRSQDDRAALIVAESSTVAQALIDFVFSRTEAEWRGTCKELLGALGKHAERRGLPNTPRGLSGEIRRLAPVLRKAGIEVELPSDKNRGGTFERRREVKLRRRDEGAGEPTVQTVQPSKIGLGDIETADSGWTVELDESTEQPSRVDSATVGTTASTLPASDEGVLASVRRQGSELGDWFESAWTGPAWDSSRESSRATSPHATSPVDTPKSRRTPTQPRLPFFGVDDDEPADAEFEAVSAPATSKKKRSGRRTKHVDGGAT